MHAISVFLVLVSIGYSYAAIENGWYRLRYMAASDDTNHIYLTVDLHHKRLVIKDKVDLDPVSQFFHIATSNRLSGITWGLGMLDPLRLYAHGDPHEIDRDSGTCAKGFEDGSDPPKVSPKERKENERIYKKSIGHERFQQHKCKSPGSSWWKFPTRSIETTDKVVVRPGLMSELKYVSSPPDLEVRGPNWILESINAADKSFAIKGVLFTDAYLGGEQREIYHLIKGGSADDAIFDSKGPSEGYPRWILEPVPPTLEYHLGFKTYSDDKKLLPYRLVWRSTEPSFWTRTPPDSHSGTKYYLDRVTSAREPVYRLVVETPHIIYGYISDRDMRVIGQLEELIEKVENPEKEELSTMLSYLKYHPLKKMVQVSFKGGVEAFYLVASDIVGSEWTLESGLEESNVQFPTYHWMLHTYNTLLIHADQIGRLGADRIKSMGKILSSEI
jgi:hypothetical protein